MKKLALLSVCIPMFGYAETVGWWRFDEHDPGVRASGSSGEMINSASSEYGAGKVFSVDSAGVVGSDEKYYPVYSGPQKGANNRILDIYDPVTGKTYGNRSSLTFVKDGTASANNGGGVNIPNDSQFRISTYTVELFFKSTDSSFDTIAPIIGKVFQSFDAGAESWQIGLLQNGRLFLRYSGSASSTLGSGTAVVNDGLWHHLALVCSYDKSKDLSEFKLYVDGKMDFEKSKTGETKQTANFGDIYLGAYGEKTGRKLAGTVDEVRISDVALNPDQFLQVKKQPCPPVVSRDTIVWMSMDGEINTSLSDGSIDYAGGSVSIVNWNEATNSTVTAKLLRKNDEGTAVFDADVVKPFLRCGSDRETVITNSASCRITPNGESGYLIELSDYNYCGESFSAEMFFKNPAESGTAAQTLLKSNRHFQLTLNGSGSVGKIMLVYWNDGVWKNGGTIGVELQDDNWHHVAMSYDKSKGILRFYLDGKEQKAIENVNLTDSAEKCYIGSSHDKTQLFHGNIDSVRITKGVLMPDGFLCGCKAPKGFNLVVR